MSLRGPRPMTKVHGLSFIFNSLYVPELIQRLDSIETSLQLSENIDLFAVSFIYTNVISKETQRDTRCLGVIIYILYNMENRKEPCGTPAGADISTSAETMHFL
jgi:hypothetical protein